MDLHRSLLIEESEKVTHHDEERPWEGGDDRFNLGSFLCLALNFWFWQQKKRRDEQKQRFNYYYKLYLLQLQLLHEYNS